MYHTTIFTSLKTHTNDASSEITSNGKRIRKNSLFGSLFESDEAEQISDRGNVHLAYCKPQPTAKSRNPQGNASSSSKIAITKDQLEEMCENHNNEVNQEDLQRDQYKEILKALMKNKPE